jgi:hypothetical protein
MPAQNVGTKPWWQRGACHGMPTNAFFATMGVPAHLKKLCGTCKVAGDCLEAALDEERGHGRNYGVRGGLSAHERYKLLQLEAGA